jgi:alkylhydroperoxidase/carboxymuconolactone decarboxylase family protein YurZ
MSDDVMTIQTDEALMAFGQEFGKVLDPVAFLNEKNPELCAAFLRLHELTLNEGAVSKKHKFLIHAAITAAQHDREATVMHVTGALHAGASEQELLETAFTVIPVAGMPAFAVFLGAWKQAQPAAARSGL